MLLLERTLASPAENLALDEALLETAEETDGAGEVLRIWESPQIAVVIGRSSKLSEEVNLLYCRTQAISILRRSSGGAAIVMGPGCLMYAVVLSLSHHPELRAIDAAHVFVLDRLASALRKSHPGVEHCGISDLALDGRKFSGNSLRIRKTHLLYHGTLLYNFPLAEVSRCLGTPPRQPDYRVGRPHIEFIANLPATAQQLRKALIDGFQAKDEMPTWPQALTQRLAIEKYSQETWNARLP